MTGQETPRRLGPSALPRCSDLARDRGDSLVGSALPTRSFLLVEEPGTWGSAPHPTGGLDLSEVEALHHWARELSARLLLIRRPGRTPPTSRTWAVADVGARTLRVGTVSGVAELTTIDPTTDGELQTDPWYLVCAQGQHDVCCAVRGRPVARRLQELVPGVVWECSHVGGDRFAANVLVLPDGLMYGNVDEAAAGALVERQVQGRLLLDHLRGECGSAPAAQVAEDAVRHALGDDRMRAVRVDAVDHRGAGTWRIRLTHVPSGEAFEVEVAEAHVEVPDRLTCSGPTPGRLRTFSVVRMTREDAEGSGDTIGSITPSGF